MEAPTPPMTIEYIGHRIAIDDLLARYAIAIDDENFDLLDTVFAPDAILDYTASGGPRAAYPEVKAWLMKALHGTHPGRMHMMGTRQVIIDGKTARVRAYFFNPYGVPMLEGSYVYSLGGGFYNHRLALLAEGWRSVELYEHTVWRDTNKPLPHPHAVRSEQTWDFGAAPRPREKKPGG